MAQREYKHGYLPKIKYWANEYSKAVKEENVFVMDRALRKLQYFNTKHVYVILAKQKALRNGKS